MKAIVLTCDKYRLFTEHMVFTYGRLWPNHPFRFRVPYQTLAPQPTSGPVEYKKTEASIKATVLTLLDDLDDEEMVYWCIDDKYPIELRLPRLEQMHRWLVEDNALAIDGILFCRCRKMWERSYLTGKTVKDPQRRVYLERSGYAQIWIHQFLRVKVLRHLFQSFPDIIPVAKAMDRYILQVEKPASHRFYVSRENLAVFGESTSRGVITRNCYRSMSHHNLTIPDWCTDRTDRDITMGRLSGPSGLPRPFPFLRRKKV